MRPVGTTPIDCNENRGRQIRMITLNPPLRRATPDDAQALAELINLAGEDLPFHLWRAAAEDSETAWAIGRQRAKRETGGFSYANAVVLEQTNGIEACLIGYPIPARRDPVDYDNTPAMFIPLEELERLAPDTWYVNALATYPEARGKGHGSLLLSVAEQLADHSGIKGLSLIVSDANAGALKLYERHGYTAISERPMIKESWLNPGNNWVLLGKTL